ncbi:MULTISPECIES: Lsr2 family protein [unclassified Pseudonocardia]|uniref:histone-like nucleoid-structuring protein Lsr2 n=1 Tax=unclassified Pseudonocardia TaxID=2619320 RepID=UPI0001FFDDC0|nr:Lsr2 family protein [Pseudonocardia sp. Ae707_Ps1]OLM09120.1 putative Lsr2-like protein [Pseudonocardia sp. Ae707_Ps1]
MAQIHTVRFIDDLTGGEADETVSFGLDGKQFEIDLSTSNAGELRDKLAPFLTAARSSATATRRGRGKASAVSTTGAEARAHNQAVRAWARENGYTVSDRGRLPAEIMEAHAKQSGSTRAPGNTVQFSG